MSWRNRFRVVGVVLVLIALAFTFELGGLEWNRFFGTRRENVRREVYENQQSYVHGKTQDLAKYFEEHGAADSEGQVAIEALIKMQFADFDESDIRNVKLRSFLTKVRGY